MSYILFLDDERVPAFTSDHPVVVCRDFPAFRRAIQERGYPYQIHLDHDLGCDTGDGTDAMKWLFERLLDHSLVFPVPPINFYIHSQNPIGARRMSGYINDIKRLREQQ